MLDKEKKILIVGLGLIGGSYAQALSSLGYTVGAITRSRKSIDFAKEHKFIASGTTEVTKDYVSQFDIVVFALYPHVLLSWLQEYQDTLKSGALLTDVTGVKGAIIEPIQATLRPDLEFIGAHPMAGKEVYGVENADQTIFKEANYIVTPTEKNGKEAIETCKELGKTLGFARISVLSPQEHDEMIGFLSQLTHCIAVSLMTCKESRHLVDYTGDSFRDLTRIAKINEEMWSELFLMNKRTLLCQMELFEKSFAQLKKALEEEDVETMKRIMIHSTNNRKYFDE